MPKSKKSQSPATEQQIPEELVDQLLASVKHPSELLSSDGLLRQLMSRLVQKSLDAELTEHLGYDAGHKRSSTNARNGRSPKTLQTEVGPIERECLRFSARGRSLVSRCLRSLARSHLEVSQRLRVADGSRFSPKGCLRLVICSTGERRQTRQLFHTTSGVPFTQ